MLSRLLPKPSHFSLLTRVSSKFHPCPQTQSTSPLQNPTFTTFLPRFFSTGGGDDDDQSHSDVWKLSTETDEKFDPLFGVNDVSQAAPPREADTWRRAGDDQSQSAMWNISKESDEKSEALFGSGDVSGASEAAPPREADSWLSKGGGDEWDVAEGFKPWSLGGEEDKSNDLFQVGGGVQGDDGGASISSVEDEAKRREEALRLEKEDKELREVLKGPNRAFGDLIAASGITDEMLDSLIALKDFQGIKGLPPLSEIEDIRYEKNTRQSSRAEMERQKQEEVAKARVRQVDDKERAYGTGRRKCSIARVWIQPGEGNFIINDKQFDVYFPMLDHRAAILRPFSETKTLGLWDIKCTVQGGGTTGQVGAIQLGISRALQNWEPDLRPTLKSSGFLTRDSRVVERKKPGKAKARKSFQWVKR